ncbi:MAG: hypothetical protein A3K59_07035 [Euryarchaeota archaeon RBG_19FT_COMBO_69_17]|nr:MAG: hypothetical protein A3K59_07035 [Euryarchaeota archaeon RBG_19FT_COMBO_69_17]
MADARVTLADLRQRIQAFVDARGWDQYHNLKDLALALSIEASELLELFLWRPPPEPASLSPEDRERIAEELADVVIYALHLANALEADVSDAVLRKMERNEGRFPASPTAGP